MDGGNVLVDDVVSNDALSVACGTAASPDVAADAFDNCS